MKIFVFISTEPKLYFGVVNSERVSVEMVMERKELNYIKKEHLIRSCYALSVKITNRFDTCQNDVNGIRVIVLLSIQGGRRMHRGQLVRLI